MRRVIGVKPLALGSVAALLLISACGSDSSRGASSVQSQSGSAVASASGTPPSRSSASADLVDSSAAVTEAASGIEAELGSLSMFATSREMLGWMPADGRTLQLSSSTSPLFAVFSCNFGCSSGMKSFNIPDANGPLSALGRSAQNPGPLDWKIGIVTDNFPRDEGPLAAYPNQVFFTGAKDSRQWIDSLGELGFIRLDLGELVGPGISAWQVPSTWASPVDPIVGEARLFLTGKPLPAGWIPADGRVLPRNSQLGGLLQSSGFVLNGEVRAPSLDDVGAFAWAIAKDGAYPMLD